MMRMLVLSSALVLCTAVAQAQRFSITPLTGGTNPLSGELVMYVPIPATVGFDSIPQRYEYSAGMSFGALFEWNRASRLDFAAIATLNLAERGFSNPSGPQNCAVCASTMIGLGLLANTQYEIGERLQLAIGAGPELVFFGGDATSTEGTAPPPTEVSLDPAVSIGLIATAGLGYELRPGRALRFLVGYRQFKPTHFAEPTPGGPTTFTEKTFHHLLWTVGYTFSIGGAR